jgi:hypothetical protein
MFTTYITSALFGPITGDCLLIHTTKHTHTRRLKTLTTFLSQSQSLSSRKPPDFLALAVRAATAAASASTKPMDELVDNDFGVRVELLTKTLVVSSSEFHGARGCRESRETRTRVLLAVNTTQHTTQFQKTGHALTARARHSRVSAEVAPAATSPAAVSVPPAIRRPRFVPAVPIPERLEQGARGGKHVLGYFV